MEPKEISDLTFEFIVDISIGDTHCLALSKGLFVCLFVYLFVYLFVRNVALYRVTRSPST